MPPDAGDGLVEVLHRGLLDRAASDGSPAAQRALLRSLARDRDPLLPGSSVESVVERVRARVDGLGPLEPLLADPSVDEVMLNGGGEVWVERHGHLECTPVVVDEATALALIERIVAPLGLRVDRSSPLVDARLPDGSRVNAVVRPLAVDGPCLTIRRFGARAVGLREVAHPGAAALLAWAVASRANVVVCGGAGAGKTTLLNALAAEIPDHDRVVTVEDAAELRLPGRHVVRLEARPAGAEGNGEVRIRDLVRNALRMRPDRIVVGEVRAGEALDMLQAMNTGHEGSLSTCHANSPADALRRLETLVLMGDVALPLAAVREQVRSALDLVVQISRRPDGGRRVTAVAEVEPTGESGEAVVARSLTDPDGRLVGLPPAPAPVCVGHCSRPRLDRGRPMTGPLVAAVVVGVAVVASTVVLAGVGDVVTGARTRRRARALRSSWRAVGPTSPSSPWAGLVGGVRRRAVPRLTAVTGGATRSRRRADRALPALLDQVTRQLRSGASLPVAVATAASAGVDPGTVRLGDDLAAGAGLGPAVAAWHADCPTPARGLVAAALSLAGDAGGSVASVLDGVTDTLRDRIALDREVAALSSQARASAAVLVVAPVVFAGLAAAADPRVARVLLGSPLGWACLAAGAVLDTAGALWMAHLVGRSR